MLRYRSSMNVVKVIKQMKAEDRARRHQMDLERSATHEWFLLRHNLAEAATGASYERPGAGRAALHAVDAFSRELDHSRKNRLSRPKQQTLARHRHLVASGEVAQWSLNRLSAKQVPLIRDDAHVLTATTTASRAKSARRLRALRSSASAPHLQHPDDTGAPVNELMKLRELLNKDSTSADSQKNLRKDSPSAKKSPAPSAPSATARPRTASSIMQRRILPYPASGTPEAERPATSRSRVKISASKHAVYGGGYEDEVRLPRRYDVEQIRSQLAEDLEWLQRAATPLLAVRTNRNHTNDVS